MHVFFSVFVYFMTGKHFGSNPDVFKSATLIKSPENSSRMKHKQYVETFSQCARASLSLRVNIMYYNNVSTTQTDFSD